MKITIEGATQTPRWDTLEQLLREVLQHPLDNPKRLKQAKATNGKLIRIARPDGRAGYREPGTYEVSFEYTHFATREVEHVILEVK